MAEYQLPDVGEGLTEAEIVSWKVKVGDIVEINDIVVEIETAKSLVELPSPYAGTVTALLVAEGEMVAVGTPIIAIGDPSRGAGPAPADPPRPEAAPRWRSTSPTRPPAAAARARAWSAATRPTAARCAAPARARRRRRPRPAPTPSCSCRARSRPAAPGPTTWSTADEPAGPGDLRAHRPSPPRRSCRRGAEQARVLAKPPVRKLAKDLGVDLATLLRLRPGRRRSRASDVEAAAGGSRSRRSTGSRPPWSGAAPQRRARDAASRSRASAR